VVDMVPSFEHFCSVAGWANIPDKL
jgi:hypothetical protein